MKKPAFKLSTRLAYRQGDLRSGLLYILDLVSDVVEKASPKPSPRKKIDVQDVDEAATKVFHSMRPVNYKASNPFNALTKRNVERLNALLYVAPSTIDGGVGVFAKVDLPEGSYIGEYQGPEATAYDLKRSPYTLYVNGTVRDGRTILRFLNHADQPNISHWGAYHFVADRDIAAGDELTMSYGKKVCTSLSNQRRVATLRRFAPISNSAQKRPD